MMAERQRSENLGLYARWLSMRIGDLEISDEVIADNLVALLSAGSALPPTRFMMQRQHVDTGAIWSRVLESRLQPGFTSRALVAGRTQRRRQDRG